jgi:SSS family transporter
MHISVALLICGLVGADAVGSGPAVLSQRSLGPVPVESRRSDSFAGVSGGALIVAGGRKTRGDGASEGTDAVFVLPLPDGKWERATDSLAQIVWGGVSVTHNDEVICAGGTDGTRCHDDVFKLKWSDGRLTVTALPHLPAPRAYLSGAILEDVLYVAGGADRPVDGEPQHTFWALDISSTPRHEGWQELTSWSDRGRMDAVAAVQDGSLFLIGGIESPDDAVPLSSAFRFTPQAGRLEGTWRRIADVLQSVSAAASVSLGQSHIAVIGGRRGSEITGANAVLAYHTVTDTWVIRGTLENTSRFGAVAVPWQDSNLLTGGSVDDDQPARDVLLLESLPPQSRFGWVGWSIVTGYFAALLGIGYYFSKREQSTDDFFYAGRRVPWWAAGLSVIGTQISAISFIAIPGVAYATDWVRLTNSLMYSVVLPVAIFVFVPFYCRLRVATAYEYLERRFNVGVRLLGSTLFIAGQLMRIGVVVYLPALALSAVTGADIVVCVVAMALVSIIYTVMGGIEAVIWSDVLQVFVLVGGAILSLGMMIYLVGGVGQMVAVSAAAGKFHIVNWGWDGSELVLWVMIVGPLFLDIAPYVTDQAVVQRYLTTADEKQAARGLWMNLVVNIPLALLFFGIGSALFAFCKTFPEQIAVGKNDEVYPWFIVQQMPPVVSGLVIAGVFAASMSSLDSSMNSLATVIVSDFYRRFRPAVTDDVCLRLARWITVATGVFGGAIAVLLAHTEMGAIWDALRGIFGFTGGALLGVFLLAGLTRRANGPGALIGVPAGILAAVLAATTTELSFMLYGAIGAVACIVVGYVASVLIPARERDLTGLTVWTMQ